MQTVEAGIDAGFLQPGPEQPPELALAEVVVRPPCPPPREQPAVERTLRGGRIGPQTVACAQRQSRLNRARMAGLRFLLPDLHDLAHPGRGGHVGNPQALQVGAPEAGVEG